MKYQPLREECLQSNLDLVAQGLVDMTFGNVSVFDANNRLFAIKPSGVAYNKLGAGDIVIVDLEGNVVDGVMKPSSDTPTHRCLYLTFGDAGIRAIVHTHSRHAVAFAQAGKTIPCLGTTHADYFYGRVPLTNVMTEIAVQGDYEWETGNAIVASFHGRDPMRTPAVLVQGHGPFAWGETGQQAVENALALEVIAEMAIHSLAINPELKSIPDYLLDKHFNRKHGRTAYYGQNNS